MRSVNKVILIGHLAADPEIRETKSPHEVANISLATNRDWVTTEGEAKQATDFHRIVVWDGLVKVCQDFLTKGMGIYLEGKIQNRSYETKTGDKRYVTEIQADVINILSWKKKGERQEVSLEEPKVD